MVRTECEGEGAGGGRERLLEAAARELAAKGYAGESVRDIVRAAAVAAPVLYHYFGSKEGLFLALARDARAKVEAACAEASGAAGPAAARILRSSRAAADPTTSSRACSR